jgi:hypothetical protein
MVRFALGEEARAATYLRRALATSAWFSVTGASQARRALAILGDAA